MVMNVVWFVKAFGNSAEAMEVYISRGIISWGAPVQSVFDYGLILTQQARTGQGIA